jgi:hypothetical protein
MVIILNEFPLQILKQLLLGRPPSLILYSDKTKTSYIWAPQHVLTLS